MGIVGRRKRTFLELLGLLRAVEANDDDLFTLRRLNAAILRSVLRTEADIARHKATLKRLRADLKTGRGSKSASKALRSRIKASQSYIERYTKQLWLWKLFGDSVAFIYLDKFSIKHAYFSVDDYDVKRDAGILTGKDGLANEIGLLISALDHHVPAVLCDVTNMLRYGDICLLGGSDPSLIEVKSSEGLNQRGKRQAEKLEKLQGFLDTDRATKFRGAPGEVLRRNVLVPERSYEVALNNCIARAKAEGYCMISPEPGLYYVAAYDGRVYALDEFTKEVGDTLWFSWNDAKNIPDWAPYTPFLLTIRDPEQLLDFIEGRLIIKIIANASNLASMMSTNGWRALFNGESAYAVQCFHVPTGVVMSLSAQFVSRIGYECCSPNWVAESQIAGMSEMIGRYASEGMRNYSVQEIEEWHAKFGIDVHRLANES